MIKDNYLSNRVVGCTWLIISKSVLWSFYKNYKTNWLEYIYMMVKHLTFVRLLLEVIRQPHFLLDYGNDFGLPSHPRFFSAKRSPCPAEKKQKLERKKKDHRTFDMNCCLMRKDKHHCTFNLKWEGPTRRLPCNEPQVQHKNSQLLFLLFLCR